MSAPNGGAPAFPANELNGDGSLYAQHFGLTLRDYFAAAVMPSLITPVDLMYTGYEAEAKTAYAIADAMLKARAQ